MAVCSKLSDLIISPAISLSFHDIYLPLSIFAKENTPLFLQNANVSEESKAYMGENSEHAETFFFAVRVTDQELIQVCREVGNSSSFQIFKNYLTRF